MTGSRRACGIVAVGVVLLLAVAACGSDDTADPKRFCEIEVAMEQLDDPMEQTPDDARETVREFRDLFDEWVRVAPNDIRPSALLLVDSFTPFFELFEAADFDASQIDPAELEALFETAFSGESGAAFDATEAWAGANCST